MSQAGTIAGGGGPPPVIVRAYTAVTFSGMTNSYTVLSTDDYISVDAQIPGTIILPTTPITNQEFEIKDRTGHASTNNITVSAGATTIDLAASYVIAGNFGAIKVLYHSSNYEVS